ncbi:MBL fold metallo-hydrolase [Zooshikella harenae]|uniref:MBL fold metallo-hydrolase n=1 Tax=Zooshikella harenae TaxID=2827238 RepID=A0ABS5Z6E8_9GAMM|nr:MBL fold metallo-hydrolase [Zooshikella harenae]MBU2709631.1 MBL fold metallo-hydrolase [Zooshikella harenae]
MKTLFYPFVLSILGCFFTSLTNASEVIKLEKNIYAIEEDGFTSLVILSNNGVLITDPANTLRAEKLQKQIKTLTDQPVTKIVLSHEHYDHVGGTEIFSKAKVICHSSCEEVFQLDTRNITPKKVHITFDKKLSFKFGNTTINLHHFGPADGFSSTVIYLPENAIAFSADLYADRYLIPGIWMDNDNYLGILNALKKMQSWQLKHAVNSHATTTSVKALNENTEFVTDLYNLVNTNINNTISTEGVGKAFDSINECSQALKLPKYKHWTNYNTELPAHIRRMALSILHGG